MLLAWTLAKKEEHCFDSLFQKGKPLIIIIKLTKGLGYVSTPISSASESEEPLYYDHSSGSSSWESDVSVGNIFKEIS